MIRFAQIDENKAFDEEEKSILQLHLNKMFWHINAFMICMVPGFVPEEQIPPALKNSPLVRDHKWACPVSMGDEKQSLEAMKKLIVKVFDEDKFHDLTIGEKYALARISSVGIEKEEQVINDLASNASKNKLNHWMKTYQIASSDERTRIKRKLIECGEDIEGIEEWLMKNGMAFRNRVVSSIGCLPLVKYEYPTAITALFTKDEWVRIVTMQDLEIAGGR